ncbi:MAG: response regulator [Clostridiaceae bacterium]|nr:response regulator [Clostridiaceae bacterium]
MSDASPAPQRTLLFLDDDTDVLAAAEMLFGRRGFLFHGARTPELADTILNAGTIDVLLLDLNFRRGDTTGEAGLAFLDQTLKIRPALPVVIVTGHSGISIAVRAMRSGAADFVVKPWHNERFIASVIAAIESPRSNPMPPMDLNLERSERELIRQALTRHGHNISHAAKDLGLTRAALYRRMEKHGL